MIDALTRGLEAGLWTVGFFSSIFVGLTILAGVVKVGRAFSGHPKGGSDLGDA
ncbi:hypothetical protein [Candidatus Nitrospira bockiana]